MNKQKNESTYDRWMKDPEFKEQFDKEYQELLLSELVLSLMAEDEKSVRKLAKEMNISKTIIQNLRSGKQTDMKFSNFMNMAKACGYSLVLEKEDKRIPINI